MRLGLFVLFFSVTTILWSQKISQKRIARQLKKIEVFQQAHLGIHLSSLKEKKPIANYQGEKYMTPASNTKLLTFLGAIQQFKILPALAYLKESDSIIHFKSTGYPLLFHPFYKDSIFDSFFEQKKTWNYHPIKKPPRAMGSGWAWDDYSYYYASETSSFPIFGNATGAYLENETVKTIPSFFETKIVLDTTAKALIRNYKNNTFRFNPNKWQTNDTLYRPFITSDSLFVKLLGEKIGQKIAIASDSLQEPNWNFLYTEQEQKLYKGLLQNSDNGIAEALLNMISQKNFNYMHSEKAIALLLKQWNAWLPDPIKWVDGSGISRYNMVTPRTLVSILKKIHQTVGWQTIQKYFPQGATSGTLKKYSNTAIYAKTGTLRHNHNLSGYLVLSDEEIYTFSIMVNHHTASTDEIRAGIGSLLKWFAKKLR
ncbi:MAG: D-alanyl-D-alanine carboxypeptidase [Flavobacteriaceae bacterium]|nr:D-alanyl-D-alanine carboxypeptidase [Flavobacteriaceae bacterium]